MQKKQQSPSPEVQLDLFRKMLVIRYTEMEIVRLYARGEIPGGCHTYIGEEAVAAGVCQHLNKQDAVFSTHRGHGHALAKGMSMDTLIAELLGREGGSSQGRGGSMHLFAPEIGFYGTSGIVGPAIGLATGGGYAFASRKQNQVSVAFFGDGASNNGIFHEAINLGAAFQLPVLYVCENNLYATECSFDRVSASPSIAARADGLGLPGIQVDGKNVLDVYQAAGIAADRARAGKGPTLIECLTYRFRSHAEGMREVGYRSEEEVDQWKELDPIEQLRSKLINDGEANQETLTEIDQQIKDQAKQAAKMALQSPFPNPETIEDHVFADSLE